MGRGLASVEQAGRREGEGPEQIDTILAFLSKACLSAATSAGETGARTSATPGTITVSAEASTSSPCSARMLNPPTTRIGSLPSAQTFRSYHGTRSSGLDRPKISTTQPSSKGDMPSKASAATVGRREGGGTSMNRIVSAACAGPGAPSAMDACAPDRVLTVSGLDRAWTP
ncbi:hypothetical protein ACFQGX_28140 [Nonomuraea dietziae]